MSQARIKKKMKNKVIRMLEEKDRQSKKPRKDFADENPFESLRKEGRSSRRSDY